MDAFDPAAFASGNDAQVSAQPPTDTSDFDPAAFAQEGANEQFNTPGETTKAALEGIGQGIVPGFKSIEQKLFHVPIQNIEGREAAHPIVEGAGQTAGLVGSAMSGVGLGALASEAGDAVAGATGLNALRGAEGFQQFGVNGPSLGFKVGSAAVKSAAEFAAIQGNEEANKMIMSDPGTTAETALSNIGLAAALGGGGGAFFAGAVNPLWDATVGPKVNEMLTGLKDHLNGDSKLEMPDAVKQAFADTDVVPSPAMQAALSGNPKALDMAQTLYRAENPEFMAEFKNLPQQAQEHVANSIGVPLEDVAVYSRANEGAALKDNVINEMKKEVGPIKEALDKREEEQSMMQVSDDDRINFANKLVERATDPKIAGTNSDYYKIYQQYGQKILGEDTVGGLTRLQTELNKKKSLDGNESQAWRDIRQMIGEFKEQMSGKAVRNIDAGDDPGIVAQLLKEHAQAGQSYAKYANDMDTLGEHLGIGDFRGPGSFESKVSDLTPESFIRRFSTKGDTGSAAWLQQKFPQAAEMIRQYEAKEFLKPSIKTDAGETVLDIKNLSKRLENLMKGQPEHANFILKPEAIKAIQNAKVINDALSKISGIRNSGTPAGLAKIFSTVGSSALGAVGWLMGHNPVSGLILGEAARRLGKDAPEAYRLAMLKFLGSDKNVNPAGFKAMADYIEKSTKAAATAIKATKAVLTPGVQVLAANQMPTQDERLKLDKQIEKTQSNPEMMMTNQSQGQLGHYMPDHQAAFAQLTTTQQQYLQNLRPKSLATAPLDVPVEASKADEARYQRAQDIAIQPNIVLQRIKDGTLQTSDIQDLNALYPNMRLHMVQKLSDQMSHVSSDKTPIPYRTRMSLSLFLGQPLDSSMQPQNIIAAQPQPKAPPPQGPVKGGGKSMKSLGKTDKSYMTPSQSAESDRSDRD